MIANKVFPQEDKKRPRFRWRGGDVSRIEALTDMVFAFALTLIVVSSEVPATFEELVEIFKALPAFIASFAILVMCWFFNYLFHRRYGLEDAVTIILNALFLLLILLYVYPLKFMLTTLWAAIRGLNPGLTLPDGTFIPAIRGDQMQDLMVIYSGGFAGIFLIFALLQIHAYRKREALQLNAYEVVSTRIMVESHLISCAFGCLSVILALISRNLIPIAGFAFFGLPFAHFAHGYFGDRRAQRVVG